MCADTSNCVTVTVEIPVSAGADGNTAVCNNSTTDLDLISYLTNPETGGTWEVKSGSPGAAFTAATGMLDPESLTAGNYEFNYIVTGTPPCPNDTAVVTVRIEQAMNPGTPSNTSACSNDTNVIDLFGQLAGEGTGGTWSVVSGTPGGNFNAGAGTINPNGLAGGDYVFRYLLTAVSPCTDQSADITVTVVDSVTAGTMAMNTSACNDDNNVVNLFDLLTGEDAGGVWSEVSGGAGANFQAVGGTFNPFGSFSG